MGNTPDPFGDEINLRDAGEDPTEIGAIALNAGIIKGRDSDGVFNLRDGLVHESIDSLIHDVAENAFLEVNRTSDKVQSIIYWTDNTKVKKIRETVVTRSPVTVGKIASFVERQFDAAGTIIAGQTISTSVNRSGGKVVSMDLVET